MAYRKSSIEKQACEALKGYYITKVVDLLKHIQCAHSTFYKLNLHKSPKIKTLITNNTISVKLRGEKVNSKIKKDSQGNNEAGQSKTLISSIFSFLTFFIASRSPESQKKEIIKPTPTNTKLLKCSRCLEMLSFDKFWSCKTTTRGYSYDCKECTKIKDRERRVKTTKAKNRKKKYENLEWPVAPQYKRCGICEKLLPSSLFNRQKVSKDGLQHACRHCAKEKYSNKKNNSQTTINFGAEKR